jgi:hypothetical protein
VAIDVTHRFRRLYSLRENDAIIALASCGRILYRLQIAGYRWLYFGTVLILDFK